MNTSMTSIQARQIHASHTERAERNRLAALRRTPKESGGRRLRIRFGRGRPRLAGQAQESPC